MLANKSGDKAFFIYGFAKNARENVTAEELKVLELLAKVYLKHSDAELKKVIKACALIEVK